LLTNLTGHTDAVLNLALLANKSLISCSADKTILIWDLNNGKISKILRGHTNQIFCVCSIENDTLASSSLDWTIRIWNVRTGEVLLKIQKKNFLYSFCLLLLSNGNLASGESDRVIKIYNVTTGMLVNSLFGKRAGAYFLTNVNSKHLASSFDETIEIWNYIDGFCLRTLKSHSNHVRSLALLKNGTLVSASLDRTLKIWALTNVLSDGRSKLEYCNKNSIRL
jgi:WD40 repeat protein